MNQSQTYIASKSFGYSVSDFVFIGIRNTWMTIILEFLGSNVEFDYEAHEAYKEYCIVHGVTMSAHDVHQRRIGEMELDRSSNRNVWVDQDLWWAIELGNYFIKEKNRNAIDTYTQGSYSLSII